MYFTMAELPLVMLGIMMDIALVFGAGSSSNLPPCQFKNEQYELADGPAQSPTWGSVNSALELTMDNYEALYERLQQINDDVISNVMVNNIDNFISFYHSYNQSTASSFQNFFEDYTVKSASGEDYVNHNVKIVENIITDQYISEQFPNIADSIFFAASVPNVNATRADQMNIDRYKCFTHFTGSPLEGNNDFWGKGEVVIRRNYKNCAAKDEIKYYSYDKPKAVIKIAFTNIVFSGEAFRWEGLILLDPEFNWNHPKTVINPDIPSANSDSFHKAMKPDEYNHVMVPDGTVPIYTAFMCPIINYNLKGWEMRKAYLLYQHFWQNPNYIVGLNCVEVIYVGSAYCSILDTTEKYKLLSPYRSFVKRNKKGKAAFGIYVTAFTSEKPKQINALSEFTLIYTEGDAIISEGVRYHDLDDLDLIQTSKLELVATNLGLSREVLIDKINQLENVLLDTDFLKAIQKLLSKYKN